MATAPLTLDSQFCFSVYSAAHALNRVYKPLLDRLGVTYPQYLVLLVLWERDQRLVGEIGDALKLDSSTLTPLLKRMEAAGILKRTRGTEDQRQVRVALTERGRALKEQAADIPAGLLAASGCSVPELVALRDALFGVRDSMLAASA